MSETNTMIVAVPATDDRGLDAERSGHFGHCECFTLATLADGAIGEVKVLENLAHAEGGCLRPVGLLASAGVNAIVVAGIGARPLAGFNEAGIDVYFDDQRAAVRDVLDALLAGTVERIDPSSVCGAHH